MRRLHAFELIPCPTPTPFLPPFSFLSLGTSTAQVERQVAEQLRQRGLLPASPSDDSAGVPSRAQFDAMVEEAVSQETHFTAALDLSALRAEGRG